MNMEVNYLLAIYISMGASYYDIRYRKIPNSYWLINMVVIVIMKMVSWLYNYDLPVYITGMIFVMIIHILPFHIGIVYAGDIKLFMMLGFILGCDITIYIIAVSYIVGGVYALIYMIYHQILFSRLKNLYSYIQQILLTGEIVAYRHFSNDDTIQHSLQRCHKKEIAFSVCAVLAIVIYSLRYLLLDYMQFRFI